MEAELLTTDITAEIRKANDKFESTFARGDAAGMAELYTEDGMLLPAGSGIVEGKADIEAFWKGAMDMGIKQAKLETIDIEQLENTAIEIGNCVLSGEDGQVLDKGKYLVVWKKRGGEWKLQKDIWNSNSAPA